VISTPITDPEQLENMQQRAMKTERDEAATKGKDLAANELE
jgi:hypothetical protein